MNEELINKLFNKEKKKVELVFENSNTILTGGLDKEDDKLNIEIFLDKDNDKDKIDNLLSTKNLTNQYLYDKNGKSNIDTYNGENLLIKGNNLVVLHTLKERFTNKIDVIYIDPPYYFHKTKAKDSFAYNSNFELSTWLVFMKNRLEIAKELLSDNGVIFISMNEDGNSYLKLLCDEIFTNIENNNFTYIFSKTKTNEINNEYLPTLGSNIGNIKNSYEKLLVYTKIKLSSSNKGELLYSRITNSKNKKSIIELKKGIKCLNQNLNFIFKGIIGGSSEPILILNNEGMIIENGILQNDIMIEGNFRNPNFIKHLMNKPEEQLYDNKGQKILNLVLSNTGLPHTVKEQSFKTIPNIISGFGDTSDSEKDLKILNINFPYSKQVDYIKYIIDFHSNNDITILDFFAGSGTTGHAVMDLNKKDGGTRKFILVEQMDYIETISSERLKRCIQKYDYDESFIYCELEESNIKELKRKIKSVNSKEELIELIELNFKDKKDEIYSYMNLIEQIAPKKANKLYEMIRMLFLYYIPLDEDYVSFNGNNTFSNSLLTINK